jgi:hypothetical protein
MKLVFNGVLLKKEVYYDIPKVFQIYDCVGKDVALVRSDHTAFYVALLSL